MLLSSCTVFLLPLPLVAYAIARMRRSLAPSQIAKRHQTDKDDDFCPNKKLKAGNDNSHYSPQVYISPFRKPLAILSQNAKKNTIQKHQANPIKASQNFPDHNSHEEFIKKILSKPFKLPIPDYKGRLLAGRGLGVRRQLLRKPLHDPFEENALVLYSPPEISAHDAIKMDKTKIPVHVVVDPVLAKVHKCFFIWNKLDVLFQNEAWNQFISTIQFYQTVFCDNNVII